jgi:hypothetical protein
MMTLTILNQRVQIVSLRYEVLTVVLMSMFVFWVVMLCGLVNGYQRFAETTCTTSRLHNPEDQELNYEPFATTA